MNGDLRLDPARTALLVLDMQNDFCAADGFFARAGHDVSPCLAIVRPIDVLRRAVRPLGVLTIFTQSLNPTPPDRRLVPLRFRPEFVPGVTGTRGLTPGTWGAQILDELRPSAGEVVLEKSRYSAFFRTSLEVDLRERGIDTVVLAGVYTNVCVDATARDAFMRDFDVLVLSDCVATFGGDADLHDASLRTIELVIGVVAPSKAFLAELDG